MMNRSFNWWKLHHRSPTASILSSTTTIPPTRVIGKISYDLTRATSVFKTCCVAWQRKTSTLETDSISDSETALDRPKSHICVISLEGANPKGVKTEPEPWAPRGELEARGPGGWMTPCSIGCLCACRLEPDIHFTIFVPFSIFFPKCLFTEPVWSRMAV